MQGRLDRHRAADPRQDRRAPPPEPSSRPRICWPRSRRRRREDGGDPRPRATPIVEDRETAPDAEGLVPPALQAAVLPRRVPAGLQRAELRTSSTPTARASSASTRPASWSAACDYEVDCIIFASGFEVGTELRPPRRASTLIGRDGVRLSECWADGMRTMHGIHVHGFPNAVHRRLRAGRQPDLERHAQPHRRRRDHRRRSSGTRSTSGADEVEVTAEAEDAWMELLDSSPASFIGIPDCTPGYYNNEGQPLTPAPASHGRLPARRRSAYFEYIDGWRNSGDSKASSSLLADRRQPMARPSP